MPSAPHPAAMADRDSLLTRALRATQDQGTILARLQHEMAAHLADSGKALEAFDRHVLNPETGLVVKHRLLEGEVARQREALEGEESGDSIHSLRRRIKALESIAAKREEDREWTWRGLLAPTLAAMAAAVLASLLTYWLIGQA